MHRKEGYSIVPSDAVIINQRAYFISSEFNGFFYSDLRTNEANFIGLIPNETYNQVDLYASLQCVDNRYICLIPCTGSEIAMYDINNSDIQKISVPDDLTDNMIKFMASTVIGSDIIMFALFKPCIYKLDVYNKKLEVLCCWNKKAYDGIGFDRRDAYFRYQLVQDEGIVYIPFCNANAMLIYDHNSKRCKVELIDSDNNGYSGIIKQGDDLYCSPRKIGDKGLRWNLSDHCHTYLDSSDEIEIGIVIDSGIIRYCHAKDYQFIRSDNNLVYDKNRKTIRYYDDLEVVWNTYIEPGQIESCLKKYSNKCMLDSKSIIQETKWVNMSIFLNSL